MVKQYVIMLSSWCIPTCASDEDILHRRKPVDSGCQRNYKLDLSANRKTYVAVAAKISTLLTLVILLRITANSTVNTAMIITRSDIFAT